MEEPSSGCCNPHPFASITASEIKSAAEITLPLAALRHDVHQDQIVFKAITLREPPKSDMIPYLDLERAGKPLPSLPKLPRRVEVLYYTKNTSRIYEEVVCLDSKSEFAHFVVPEIHQGSNDHTGRGTGFKALAVLNERLAEIKGSSRIDLLDIVSRSRIKHR